MSRTPPVFLTLRWLWALPVLWIGTMFATYALFQSGGRTSVMEMRLLLGLLLCLGLWVALRQARLPATQLMGWQITREMRPVTVAVLIMGVVILAPLLSVGDLPVSLQPALVEETLFRGFIFGVLAATIGPARALWWSAVMFGGIHLFEGFGTVLGTVIAGVFLLGTARLATGNVVAAVVMHAVMNASQTNAALLVWLVAVLGSGLTLARHMDRGPIQVQELFLRRGERLRRILGHDWLAWPTAFEWQLWTLRRPVHEEGQPLTEPFKTSLPGMLQALMALLILEGIAVHFMVRGVGDPRAAYLISAVELYAVVWVYAFYRQVLLRPTVLYQDRLIVRTGLLWTAEIPQSLIAAAEQVDGTPMTGRHLSPLEKANVRLSLHAPVMCRSLWGWGVPSQEVSFRVQNPEQVTNWASSGLAQSVPRASVQSAEIEGEAATTAQ